MTFGPMQMLVVGFDNQDFKNEILPELRRLREHDVVRLVDMLLVSKDNDGTVAAIEASDLSADESRELGKLAAALVGLDDGAATGEPEHLRDDVWYVADAIPAGTTAAVVILEHRWAIPLREAIQRAGGKTAADEWLHPSDLLELGMLPEPVAG
jgi:hypothetical protein